MNIRMITATAATAFALCAAPAKAIDLTISAGLPQVHFWVGQHLDPFADAIEAATDIRFQRFYAGELVSLGRELDALEGGTIDVAAPLMAPYHEGRFPLSDITQMPTYDTTAVMITRAFQKLLDSSEKIQGEKTFYQYELADKGIRGWPLGATGPYALSSTGKPLQAPSDLRGIPLRGGSALHTIVLEQLGATPVMLPTALSYEALMRGTIEGMILSVGDWRSYSFVGVLKHTITGVSLGHWESYISVTDALWNRFSDTERQQWDRIAREAAIKNAEGIDRQELEVRQEAEQAGATFVAVDDLSEDMRTHIAKAAANTWIQWIEQTEKNGHPAKATARLWVDLVKAEGGRVPDGVAEYLMN